MAQFSKGTNIAITAQSMAETYYSSRTSEHDKRSIEIHYNNQSKPFKSSFRKHIEEHNKWLARRDLPLIEMSIY